MQKYDVVIFDLDHTLWDYHRNADETLLEIFEEFIPLNGFSVTEQLIPVFKEINDHLWSAYHRGEITQIEIRTKRFLQFLEYYQFDTQLAGPLSDAYIERGPRKTHLVPNTIETLDYLKSYYSLVILTNGFEETQRVKINCSGLDQYFPTIVTSEKAGMRKPSPAIFHHAIRESGNLGKRAIMIGDNEETDIEGARLAGYDSVHYNPGSSPTSIRATHTIEDLIQLKDIL